MAVEFIKVELTYWQELTQDEVALDTKTEQDEHKNVAGEPMLEACSPNGS